MEVFSLGGNRAEMRAPHHPWQIELRGAIDTLIFDPANDPAMAARGEKIKAELLESPIFQMQLNVLCQDVVAQANANAAVHAVSVSTGLQFALLALGKWLGDDKQLQVRLNRWGRRAALRALAPRSADIGANVVANWDASTLVGRPEQ